jgi:hypothetical protein
MKVTVAIVSKHEPSLVTTLDVIGPPGPDTPVDEILVVDASGGELDWIREARPWLKWIDFVPPLEPRVTIAHQRNIAVRAAIGDVVVFTDCGCVPQAHWLERLLAPIVNEGEAVSCGPARSEKPSVYSGSRWWGNADASYVSAAPTINIAFRRDAYEVVGGFDESFATAEDLDFTWRLTDAGYRLRWVADAMVQPDWGGPRRQLRRSFAYGRGWVRLLRKHPSRILATARETPIPFVYPIFILGLPLTLKWRAYPALLLIPLWRARHESQPWLVIADHLLVGLGALLELAAPKRSALWGTRSAAGVPTLP